MKKIAVMLILMCAGSLTWAGTYTDDVYGFSVESPAFKKLTAAEGGVTVVQFLAPAERNFSSNLNVQVQNTKMTKEEYIDTTREQMATLGFEVLSQTEGVKDGFPFIMWEHRGKMQGFDLHWLAVAVFRTGNVLLVTGTSLESDFAKNKQLFFDTFETLRLHKTSGTKKRPGEKLKLE